MLTDTIQENGKMDSLALKREAYVKTRLAELKAEFARIVASYQAAIAELEKVLEVGEHDDLHAA